MCTIIAIPTERKGDYMDFWSFIVDDGRQIPQYGVRFIWRPELKDQIKYKLARAKLDYRHDINRLLKDRRVIAYESTQRRRMMFAQMRKMITEIMNDRYDDSY